ncbi:MAG: rRNA maturation RNase YbeY [Patescibacteria group bacterium]|nr:rRNA maturation RNase YbeY [Patescibacteria group bacterium]
MKNEVLVFSVDKKFKKFEKRVKEIALEVLKVLKKKNTIVEIYLAGDGEMRDLNKKYRGKNKITDILSFKEPKTFPNPDKKGQKLGEIYLNPDRIKNYELRIKNGRLNKENSDLFTAEELIAHGILHILDYGHEKESDRIRMKEKEKFVIRKLIS